MALRDRADNVEAQTGPFHARRELAGHAIKALENLLQLYLWNAGSAVFHAHEHILAVRPRGLYRDLHRAVGILHRVIDEVGDGRAHLIWIAQNSGWRARMILERVRRNLMQRQCSRYTFLHHSIEINAREIQLVVTGGADASGAQHL